MSRTEAGPRDEVRRERRGVTASAYRDWELPLFEKFCARAPYRRRAVPGAAGVTASVSQSPSPSLRCWAAARLACSWHPRLPQYQSATARSLKLSFWVHGRSSAPSLMVHASDFSSQRPQEEHFRTRVFVGRWAFSLRGLGYGGLRFTKASGESPEADSSSTAFGVGATRQWGHRSLRSTNGSSVLAASDSQPRSRSAHCRGSPSSRGETGAVSPQDEQRSSAEPVLPRGSAGSGEWSVTAPGPAAPAGEPPGRAQGPPTPGPWPGVRRRVPPRRSREARWHSPGQWPGARGWASPCQPVAACPALKSATWVAKGANSACSAQLASPLPGGFSRRRLRSQ